MTFLGAALWNETHITTNQRGLHTLRVSAKETLVGDAAWR